MKKKKRRQLHKLLPAVLAAFLLTVSLASVSYAASGEETLLPESQAELSEEALSEEDLSEELLLEEALPEEAFAQPEDQVELLQTETDSLSAPADTLQAKKTGLYAENGQLRYYRNGVFRKVTGLVRNRETGKLNYVENGIFLKKTGLARSLTNKKWYYVKKGVKTEATGLTRRISDGKWFYVKNGRLCRYTGVVPRITDGKLFYVCYGRLDRTLNGVVVEGSGNDGVHYIVKNGVVKKTEEAPGKTKIISSLATYSNLTNKTRDRGDFQVRFIIVHHMAGRMTGAQCADYFVHNTVGTSANYCIGYDGDIACNVPEGSAAITSGSPEADKQAITIEVSDTANDDWRIPKPAQKSLIKLIADIAKRYPSFKGKVVYDTSDEDRVIAAKYGRDSWDKVRGNILIHKWASLNGTGCPEWHMISILPSLCERADKHLH